MQNSEIRGPYPSRDRESLDSQIELSVVIPCLNEVETLGACIEKAQRWLHDRSVKGEVVVADNGSLDGSQELAAKLGARVIHVESKGYGSALMGGIVAARGTYIIIGDGDDSYDFSNLGVFLERLRQGYPLVMGNRFQGGIAPGAMPALHKYVGNPLLSGMGRLFFGSSLGDFHCGLRGFRRAAILDLDLQTTGMEFASEMVVKAILRKLPIAEVPTTLSPDGRSRPPHLRSWRDGWRHLRFLFLYSPRWLFLYPGALLMLIGVIGATWLVGAPRTVGRVTLDVHTLLYAALGTIIGFQAVIFFLFTKIFAMNEGLLPADPLLARMFRYITLEAGLVVGWLFILIGLLGSLYAVGVWGGRSYGALDPSRTFRIVIPAATLLMLGCQIVLSSFFLSVLGLKRR
jgi:hypothetical protein